jgi:hypothetical protein
VRPRRRTAAGLVLGAAGMLASRLSGRRDESGAPGPAPVGDPPDPAPSSEEVERARAELAEELARRSGRADNSPE